MELSDRILHFLGVLDTDPAFLAFLNETKPWQHFEGNSHSTYHFKNLGLMLMCHGSSKISSAAFHIHTRAVRTGEFAAYQGMLPFGITAADTRKQVSSKLGVPSFRSTPDDGYPDRKPNPCEEYPTWWDRYRVPPFALTFVFRSALSGMEMLGVHYIESAEELCLDVSK